MWVGGVWERLGEWRVGSHFMDQRFSMMLRCALPEHIFWRGRVFWLASRSGLVGRMEWVGVLDGSWAGWSFRAGFAAMFSCGVVLRTALLATLLPRSRCQTKLS